MCLLLPHPHRPIKEGIWKWVPAKSRQCCLTDQSNIWDLERVSAKLQMPSFTDQSDNLEWVPPKPQTSLAYMPTEQGI